MKDPRPCDVCGGPLSWAADAEFCPSCLLREGLTAADDSAHDDVVAGADPASIGPYRIVRRLGEGGMGVVYLAEQHEPIRREVAIKLIKVGVNSKQVLARFRMEQQTLAVMDHPGIARIIDAGTAADGQPYFVMEHVDGCGITEYCDRRRLTNRDRVALFGQVCQAVQHAHQRGVIHRDLKPSNILVADGENGPQAKIIDFGVAKATEKRFLEWSVFTELGRLLGTPVYMSPEQAGDSDSEVDTRTDVYSLGVVLYELLVGTTPLDESSLREAGLQAILETVRNASFPAPSSRAGSLGDAGGEAAASRSTNPGALSRELRGELDWIVMRALERDKERRFRSPGDLADDLQRFLDHRPVESGPPSAFYRLRKLARRHRVAVAVTAAVCAGLLTGIVGVAVGLVRAREAESEARQQADIAKATNAFLTEDLLRAVQPDIDGPDVKVVDLLARAGGLLETRYPDAPLTRASIHYTIGRAEGELGRYDAATEHLVAALELSTELLGEQHESALQTLCDLAAVHVLAGRVDEGLAMSELCVERMEAHPDATAANRLDVRFPHARFLWASGERQGALEMLEPMLEEARELLGPRHTTTLTILSDLGMSYLALGDLERSAPMIEEAVALYNEVAGPDHPDTLGVETNLSTIRLHQRDYESASAMIAALRPRYVRVYGNDHPKLINLLANESVALAYQGRLGEAAALQLELAERYAAQLGPTHKSTLGTRLNYASMLLDDDRSAEAVEPLQIALAGFREIYDAPHPDIAYTLSQLGVTADLAGDYVTAIDYHAQAVALRDVYTERQGDMIAKLYDRYARALTSGGRDVEAIAAFREAERLYENPKKLAEVQRRLGELEP